MENALQLFMNTRHFSGEILSQSQIELIDRKAH